MTTPSTERKAGPLLGTGAQTTWPFTFKVFAATDIAVTIADSLGVETALVYGVDYSVTLNSNQETSPGGTVTYPISGAALPVGKRLVIFGNLPYDQPLDLPSGGNFSPLALENQLDRLAMQIQQLRENVGRALQVSVTTGANIGLPAPSANELIGWDSTGDNLQNFALGELATAVAYATMRYDTFTGDGAETQFTLTADPVTLANLDIAIGGVTQTPGSDYSLVAGVLVFTSAPPDGAEILARYGEGLVNVGGDSSDIRYLPAGTGAVASDVQTKLRQLSVAVEDYYVAGESDHTQAFIRAATYLLSQPNPGGTIQVNSQVSVTAGQINFWNILVSAQGLSGPPYNYLPNGELTRGTAINLKGQGPDQSTVTITGAGSGFTWGYFNAINDQRGMSGIVDGIYFKGTGTVGHTSQAITNGSIVFNTTTNANAGTTNTTTTALDFRTVTPLTQVSNCRFRFLQRGVFNLYGFGLVLDGNQIQYCNIGVHIGNDCTTWQIRDGNEIEVCAVGVFSEFTQSGTIGHCVIEANIAGCDILSFGSRFLRIDGTWFEGSLQNVVLRGDPLAPSLPNAEHVYRDAIGLNVDNNGGVRNFTAERCHMNTLGENWEASTGEQFENIAYDNCTLNGAAFDVSGISVGGIASTNQIKIYGPTVNGDIGAYGMREPIKERGCSAVAAAVVQSCFSLAVPNIQTTTRVVITATKTPAVYGTYRTYLMRYVGYLVRTVGGATVWHPSATDSFTEVIASTGTTDPVLVASPTVVIAGATSGSQSATFQFATGTPVSDTSSTVWDLEVFPDVDGIVVNK